MDKGSGFHGKAPRLAVAAVVATGTLTLFAALGGAGTAQDAISASQYQYGKKTTICHKGKNTITVSNNAVPAHLRHGDTVGSCSSAAAKAKKAKLKAAKLKAAKAKAGKGNKPDTPHPGKGERK